ncbi:hypothetical protein CMI45_01980 [Candidatus Pacearchaeota archaeon]|nr:hypothetical protein [Candidatus Pacearchaeota archaeon]|tara:strand:+ start:343 stop:639 length:297 start_codon:yes stop_codon:yes gene_type:complete
MKKYIPTALMALPIVLSTLSGCASDGRIPTQREITRAESVLKNRWTSLAGLLGIFSGRLPEYDSHPSEQIPHNYTTKDPEASAILSGYRLKDRLARTK